MLFRSDGETVETVADFILGGFKITADDDCSHEIKRCLLLGRKAVTNLDSVLKSRDGPGNRGRSACGPTHVARLEFPRDSCLENPMDGGPWKAAVHGVAKLDTTCGGGGAPRDSAGFGAMEEGLISRGGRNLSVPLVTSLALV